MSKGISTAGAEANLSAHCPLWWQQRASSLTALLEPFSEERVELPVRAEGVSGRFLPSTVLGR
eukprot:7533870-Prorocentrum_lima.AAC.1